MRGRPKRQGPSARPAALRRSLRAIVRELERDTSLATERPPAPPELLHDLHRELRRLSGGLALWAALLPGKEGDRLLPALRRLKRLSRSVGDVRDRDVTLALVERASAPRGDQAQGSEELRKFVGRLRDDASTGRELLRASLTTARRDGLLEELHGALARPLRTNADRELERLFEDGWRDHRRKTSKAHRRARQRPSAGRLHRLRIRLRRWRQFATLAELSHAVLPERVGGGLGALQDGLGEIHDLDVALALLPGELARSPIGQRLARSLREKRATLLTTLERRRNLARKARPRRAVAAPEG